MEELQTQLQAAITAIETGDQWRDWLNLAQRLHRYSFNNLILIWQQRPDATAVAGYNTWKATGRQVRRGERAIRVLAPITRSVLVLDKHGQPVRDADGKPVKRQPIVGFRPAPVFDMAQTDGPPIGDPRRPVLLAGQAPPGLWDALVGEVNARGYRLLRGSVRDLDGSNGRTRITAREVWVRDDVDDAQAVKTLVHELAHVILHAEERSEPGWCRGIAEIEAESVAHLVLASHQVQTDSYTFPYVAAWAHPLASVEQVPMADIVARTGDRVMKAARQILAVTEALPNRPAEPAVEALADRVSAAAAHTADLRDHAAAAAVPDAPRAALLGVVADSHDYFRRQVPASWVPDYLSERGLGGAATVEHQIGYAPAGWTDLVDHLRGLGYTDAHIEAAGMASRSRRGQLIDRFRDRMTFPLHDENGDLVGFTGRSSQAADDAGPKYLNTPTTSMFRKGEVLYGLPVHSAAIGDGAVPVLCEGPLDAIAISQVGAENGLRVVGVATIGTAFTDAHAAQILQAVDDRAVCLAFDGDRAGARATEVIWRRLTESAPHAVTALALPEGGDPASLYASEPRVLADLLRSAKPAARVIADHQIDEARLDGNVGRELNAFRSLVELAARMPIDQRTDFVLHLARRLHIEPTDAATIAVDASPRILLDAVTDRCEELGRLLAPDDAGVVALVADSPMAMAEGQMLSRAGG